MTIEITVFAKIGGPLTKHISLTKNGTFASDGSACVMGRGTARRVKLGSMQEFADLIEKLKSEEALALGVLRSDLADEVEVVTKERVTQHNGTARPDIIARTGAYIAYQKDRPTPVLLDYDSKGMPPNVAAELRRLGGFWEALVSVLPVLADATHLTRLSTSAGLYRSDTGQKLPGSNGMHVYIVVFNGDDVERFLPTLHDRCWLAGLGWMVVSSSGALLERSIVDRTVGSPERLVFEGPPILVQPLKQDLAARLPKAVAGDIIDTIAACPPLTIVETAKVQELKAREGQRLAPEVAKARTAFVAAQAKELAKRTGKSEQEAKKIIERQCEGVLHPDVVLPFDDPDLAGCTVRDVLADPERFDGATLADPLEGVSYGRCVAKIMRRADGMPWIHSFAHGRMIYHLTRDAAAVRSAMETVDKKDAAKMFVRLAVDADLDQVEIEELRQLAKQLSGTNLKAIDAALQAALKKKTAQRMKETRNRQEAERRDPRPQIPTPYGDDPWRPVMRLLNDVIGEIGDAVPPMRDIDGVVTRARLLPVPNTHAFSQASAEEGIEE